MGYKPIGKPDPKDSIPGQRRLHKRRGQQW